MMRFYWLLLALCWGWPVASQSSFDAFDSYQSRVYVSGVDSLQYRILLPEEYDETEKYPLLLFLHGMGEWGDDNRKQLTHCGQMFLDPVFRERYPAIVVVPQTGVDQPWMMKEWSHRDGRTCWGFSAAPDETRSLRMLAELVRQTAGQMPVDRSRIYAVGLSMGAMGLYDFVCRYPNLLAVAVLICGGVDATRLDNRVRDVKFRIFHGDHDQIVPCDYSRQAYRRLRQIGAQVEYVELKGVDHASWYPAFNRDDFTEWIFNLKRAI